MTNAARLDQPCPIHGCKGWINRYHKPSRSVICSNGHYLVDKDAPVSHGIHQVSPGHVERG